MPKRSKKNESVGSKSLSVLVFLIGYLLLLVVLFSIPTLLFVSGSIGINEYEYVVQTLLEISFALISFLYLMVYKRNTLAKCVDQLGIGLKRLSANKIMLGLGLFLAIFLLEIVIGAISSATNIQINTNSGILLASAPVWFYIVLVVVAPVSEEILFRGLMVPRLGIIISALLFGIGHAGYDSTFGIDIISAFIFGVLAGYAFKRTKSLYPSMIAHILVNLLALLAFIYGGAGAS